MALTRNPLALALVVALLSACATQKHKVPESYHVFENEVAQYSNAYDGRPDRNLIKGAIAGDLQAQLEIAIWFAENGPDIDQENPLALQWLTIAANNGSADALNELGYIYQRGHYGAEVNLKKAKRMYKLAAKQNVAYGAYNLARLYRDGLGTKRNERKATQYMKQAADLGYTTAVFEYGLRLRDGLGIEKDESKGKQLIERAINDGFDIQEFLRSETKFPADLPKSFLSYSIIDTLAQTAVSHEQATAAFAQFLNELCELDVRERHFPTKLMMKFEVFSDLKNNSPRWFSMLLDGSSFGDQDWCLPKLRFGLARAASIMGDSDAQQLLSSFYQAGIGTGKDVREASYWLDRSEK